MSDNDNNHHDANYHHHHHSSTELPNNNNHPQQLPTPTTPALVHQHHRSRPGGPQRVSTTTPASSRVPDDAADLNNTFEEQLQLEEDQINNDDDHDAKSNALMSSAPLETVADPAECVGETDRLLDTSDQSGDATTTTTTTDDDPFGRRRASCRVRTLSGQPLSVPLNCSPAVLRHGLGTALSNNEGEVIDEEDGPADAATAATARPVGKFVEIGKRNNIKWDAALLIEGVLFRANYLGSTQLLCDGQPTKISRMLQAEEAVSRIKAPADEHQPSTEVDLCISTMKIMVLNAGTQDIIMDPALRTISYIADIGDLVVLMSRRQPIPASSTSSSSPQPDGIIEDAPDTQQHSAAEAETATPSQPPPKILCHVFESREALLIAQTIGQAFQVAYSEFLRANGIRTVDDDELADNDRDPTLDHDYQEVLSSQAIADDELQVFTQKERLKEVHVAKAAGEPVGLVLVASGWGSLLPTCVVANLAPAGAAARGGEINIGDQIIAVNGGSMVGLPLAECEAAIGRAARGKSTSVQFTLVPCPPVVEVLIRRPSTKFQLGFSVQMGVVCSLLRGGIAERGGVRVGHRIIEINEQSVVAVSHERIVSMLATAVGEIRMKTMPTSMFRLLTGQDSPMYI